MTGVEIIAAWFWEHSESVDGPKEEDGDISYWTGMWQEGYTGSVVTLRMETF